MNHVKIEKISICAKQKNLITLFQKKLLNSNFYNILEF